MSTPQPIKRSRQLTPLSRDHHEGLLLGWKIKTGISNGTERSMIAEYVRYFWKQHLEEHFREEEEILAPYMKQEPMINRMFEEHKQIKDLCFDDALQDQLEQLASLLNDHIRFEERELFPLAEKMITEEDLNRIEEELQKSPKKEETWDKEFWIRKRTD